MGYIYTICINPTPENIPISGLSSTAARTWQRHCTGDVRKYLAYYRTRPYVRFGEFRKKTVAVIYDEHLQIFLMQHKLILLTTMVLASIIISGCTDQSGLSKPTSSEIQMTDIADCLKTTNDAERIACLTEAAVQKKDMSICTKNIDLVPLQDGCIISVAVAKGDKSACDMISNQMKETTSQDKMCKAMITLDTSYCDEITVLGGVGQSTMIGTCYAFIVEKTKNVELCNQLESETAKSYCFQAAAKVT
ncbi:MAG: hypothetical protein GWP12_00810 [Nitrospirae bacterium]|nr:hypothetical protein [Nitrospirota bacterium]